MSLANTGSVSRADVQVQHPEFCANPQCLAPLDLDRVCVVCDEPAREDA